MVRPLKMARLAPLARRLIAWQFEACYHPVGPHHCMTSKLYFYILGNI